jgi:ribose 1,5-bisphosphate isomerase
MKNMRSGVDKTVKDIKSLKIQGARNIAKSAMTALASYAKSSTAKKPEEFYSDLLAAGELLQASRPTEPMLRNSVNGMTDMVNSAMKTHSVSQLKKLVAEHEKAYQGAVDKNAKALADYGAKLIPEGARVITHCHSSTVVGILKRAAELGKDFEVISCETRPRFQGRMTATDLAKAGIKVTQIVDGAVHHFMKKADAVIVGADAITARGDLINKIGTSMVAHIAKLHDVSFYSAAELYKYSPATLFGNLEKIEERDPKEVWVNPPKGVKISNLAFDVTPSSYISGYITEAGVIPSQSFFALATERIGAKIYG